jgi:hypothetical protein
MTTTWRIRALTFVGIWAAAVVVLGLMDMRPAVVSLAAVTVAVAAVLFFVLDVGDVAAPVDWRATSDGGTSARGADARVGVLRRQISDGRALDGPSTLHRTLVGLVDDALAAHHRLDRSAQPERARVLMGDELARFVDGTTAPAVLADPRQLSTILARIESLATPPDASLHVRQELR